MMKTKVDKAHTSSIDKFLQDFAQQRQLTTAERRERAKHQRIHTLRDDPSAVDAGDEVWEYF
jgi:cell division protein FtsB